MYLDETRNKHVNEEETLIETWLLRIDYSHWDGTEWKVGYPGIQGLGAAAFEV